MAKKQKVFPNIGAGVGSVKQGSVVIILTPGTPQIAPTSGTGFRGSRHVGKLCVSGKAGAHQIGKK